MRFFTNGIAKIDALGCDTLAYKTAGVASATVSAENDLFSFSTSGLAAGTYHYDMLLGGEVLYRGTFDLVQDITGAEESFDPRSSSEIVIEAIDAWLEGRATTQQRSVQVGDKSIQYSSIDELKRWREFFVEKVAEEQGHAPPSRMICTLRRA